MPTPLIWQRLLFQKNLRHGLQIEAALLAARSGFVITIDAHWKLLASPIESVKPGGPLHYHTACAQHGAMEMLYLWLARATVDNPMITPKSRDQILLS